MGGMHRMCLKTSLDTIADLERCGNFWCECEGPRTMLLVRMVIADSDYPVGKMTGCRRASLRPGMEEVGVTYSSVLVVPGSAC
jgi:hypothetical protein